MALIRSEALKQARLVPASTTNVSIQTYGDYVRMAYEHLDEDDGERTVTTTRLGEVHATGLDALSWESLLSE